MVHQLASLRVNELVSALPTDDRVYYELEEHRYNAVYFDNRAIYSFKYESYHCCRTNERVLRIPFTAVVKRRIVAHLSRKAEDWNVLDHWNTNFTTIYGNDTDVSTFSPVDTPHTAHPPVIYDMVADSRGATCKTVKVKGTTGKNEAMFKVTGEQIYSDID